jgi:hypothetical protein
VGAIVDVFVVHPHHVRVYAGRRNRSPLPLALADFDHGGARAFSSLSWASCTASSAAFSASDAH